MSLAVVVSLHDLALAALEQVAAELHQGVAGAGLKQRLESALQFAVIGDVVAGPGAGIDDFFGALEDFLFCLLDQAVHIRRLDGDQLAELLGDLLMLAGESKEQINEFMDRLVLEELAHVV